ncbi:MAG: flagellar biosynthesis protein FliQ [Lachnospiraceae bacterium]|nr:flagellar biosynthesis protein FliQ [Lachnospiraceae bacterium]
MTEQQLIDIARATLWMIIKCSAPMLIISLIVGLVISIFQTVTSIQEQTLTFVPKLLAIFLVIMIAGHWLMNSMIFYTTDLFSKFGLYIQ